MSEKLDAMERMSKAIDAVMPDTTVLTNAMLLGYHEYLAALLVDLQNEWVRREMLERAGQL